MLWLGYEEQKKYKHKGEPTIVELKSVYQIDWINVMRIHDRINLSLNAHGAALQLSHKYWITERRLNNEKKRSTTNNLETRAKEQQQKIGTNSCFDIAKMCICKVWENFASNEFVQWAKWLNCRERTINLQRERAADEQERTNTLIVSVFCALTKPSHAVIIQWPSRRQCQFTQEINFFWTHYISLDILALFIIFLIFKFCS